MKKVWSIGASVAAITLGAMTVAQATAPRELCTEKANNDTFAVMGCQDTGCEKDGGTCGKPEPSSTAFVPDDCWCLYE